MNQEPAADRPAIAPDDLLFCTRHAHDGVAFLLKRTCYHPNSGLDLLRITLHASQIELAGSILALLDAKRFVGIEIMFRAFLEATVDLRAVIRHPTYADSIELVYYEKAGALIDLFLDSDLRPDRPDLRQVREDTRAIERRLREQGAKSSA